uniref:Ragulator complex protein LAMTOR4 n=1 Tax=Gasterosteus aculeatus aculeatus TaxID=481459 RepID=A0AAQ4PSN6_GASAC
MTTAALTAGLERIPDQLGYLVISEDGVLASAGELENDEQTAAVMMQMVRTASRFKLPGSAEPPFKRMSALCTQESVDDISLLLPVSWSNASIAHWTASPDPRTDQYPEWHRWPPHATGDTDSSASEAVQTQFVGEFTDSHRIWKILFVGKNQKNCLLQLILLDL